MLGLVAGTASFAQTAANKTPEATVTITSDQRVKLIVGREAATATVSLTDADGHVLYEQNVNLRDGLRQYFNIGELDSGTYHVSISTGDGAVVKTFVIDEVPAQKTVAVRS